MPIQIENKSYDISREHLRLLIERDNPASWIAQKLLAADDGVTQVTNDGAEADSSA